MQVLIPPATLSFTRAFTPNALARQLPMLAMVFDCGWLMFAVAPMFVWLNKFVIPGEEAFLAREFGSAYEAYMETVPRWLI